LAEVVSPRLDKLGGPPSATWQESKTVWRIVLLRRCRRSSVQGQFWLSPGRQALIRLGSPDEHCSPLWVRRVIRNGSQLFGAFQIFSNDPRSQSRFPLRVDSCTAP
jgi:hypothetical protein